MTLFSAFGGVNRAQVSAVANEIAGNHQGAKDSIQLAQNYAKYATGSASYSRNMGNYNSSPDWSNYGGGSSGSDSSGSDSSGSDSSGSDSSGSGSSGSGSSGTDSSGTDSSGLGSSGTDSSGLGSSGTDSSGLGSSGTDSSGGTDNDPVIASCEDDKGGFAVSARRAKKISPIDEDSDNGQVCRVKLTEQDKRNIAMMAELQPFYDSGDYISFWTVALKYKDPTAQLALNFHDGLWGTNPATAFAIFKLMDSYSDGTGLPKVELLELKKIVGKDLMRLHFEALLKDIREQTGTKAGVLSVNQVDKYHFKYFEPNPPWHLGEFTYGGWGVYGGLYCSDCDPEG